MGVQPVPARSPAGGQNGITIEVNILLIGSTCGKEVRNLLRARNKRTGDYLLDPDYRKFMQPAGRRKVRQAILI